MSGIEKFGWFLIGCCVPIAGLIIFLVMKNDDPEKAGAAGIGALVSVIFSVIFYVIMFIMGMSY